VTADKPISFSSAAALSDALFHPLWILESQTLGDDHNHSNIRVCRSDVDVHYISRRTTLPENTDHSAEWCEFSGKTTTSTTVQHNDVTALFIHP